MRSISTFLCATLLLFWHSEYGCTVAIPRSATSTHEVWQFPNETWVENIAVRANGQLLVTFISSPVVYQVDPFGLKRPALVCRFETAFSALGIAEIKPDIFAVISGNWSDKTFSSTPGSYSLFKVDLRAFRSATDGSVISPATVTKVTDFPTGVFLNGLTLLNEEHETVLISDAGAGVVLRVNVGTGQHEVIIDDPLMKPKPGAYPVLGINGIHLHDGSLYFTNTFEKTFNRVSINADGTAAAPAATVAQDGYGDDFAIDSAGNAYVTQGTDNTVLEIRASAAEVVVAGNLNSTVVAGCTAAQFGRSPFDQSILYVTTNGGIAGPVDGHIIEGGKVVAVDVAKFG